MTIFRLALACSTLLFLALPCAATTNSQAVPANSSLAIDRAGNAVAAWIEEGSPARLFAQRYDAAGNRAGGVIPVNDAVTGVQFAEVALDAYGNFMAVWQAQQGPRLVARRFDSQGQPLGGEIVIHGGEGTHANVAGSAAGFALTWLSADGIKALRIDAAGNRVGPVYTVGMEPSLSEPPRIELDDLGAFVVSWGTQAGQSRRIESPAFAEPSAAVLADFKAMESLAGATFAGSPNPAVSAALGPAENDLFADRLTVAGPRYEHRATNDAAAANEAGEPVPSCGPTSARTVWYEFTPPGDGQYLITTYGSSFDTILAVYTGTGPFTQVGCNDQNGRSPQAQLTLALAASQTYYIQVGGKAGASGGFTFSVVPPSDGVLPGIPVISASAVGAPSTPLASGAATSSLENVLAWIPQPGTVPYAYKVEVSTSATFPDVIYADTVPEPGRYAQYLFDAPAADAGQKYYWRVAARNFLGQQSAYSPVYSFTIDTVGPPSPSLTAPALNASVSVLRPAFSWAAVAGANRYRLRIASNFSCSTQVTEDAEIATTSFTPAADLAQGEYWYCVEARDAAGNWGSFGEKRRFSVNISLTPANGATIIAAPPAYTANAMLTWTRVTGATYTLQIAPDSSFTVLDVDTQLTVNSYTFAARPPGVYYWRVGLPGGMLPQSLARSFTITPALPLAPAIRLAPEAVTAGAMIGDTTPIFAWTVPANWATPPVGSSISYELQVSTNATFTALVAPAVTGIADNYYDWTSQASLAPGLYYWRVRAVTNLGAAGPYSAAYNFTVDTTAPAAPVLNLPAANAVLGVLRPAFSWKAAASATRYGIRIAGNDTCTGPALLEAEVTTPAYAATVDIPQGEHWFCVQARDAAGNWSGFTGEIRRFVVLYALAPADNATIVASPPAYMPSVVFTWKAPSGANTSRVQVSSVANFASVVAQSGIGNTGTYTMTGVGPGKYYWRVLVTGHPTYATALARTFTISPPVPLAPVIQTTGTIAGAVANNGTTNDASPAFDWTVPTNWVSPPGGSSITYDFQLSANAAFTTGIVASVPNIADSSYQWAEADLPLTPGTTYYWRVRAVTNLGVAGPYSPAYRFTLDTQAPPAVALTSPAANAAVSTLRPAFTWAAAAGATGYRIRIATNFSCSTVVPGTEVAVAAKTYTPAFDLAQGEYWWCVESRDAAGNWSGYIGEKRRFTVNIALSPANGATIIATPPGYAANVTFTWTRVTGVTSYTLEIADDSSFTGSVLTTEVSGTTFTRTGSPPGAYYWRVGIPGGNLPLSLARSFTVTPPLPLAPAIQAVDPLPDAVMNNGFTDDTSPTFDWIAPANWASPAPGASLTYELQLSTNAAFTAMVDVPVMGIGSTSYTWPTELALTPGTIHYWRVRAVTNLGVQGPFSAVYKFTLDTVDPALPSMTAPADMATVTAARPTFTWAASAGAASYQFVIDRFADFSDPFESPFTAALSFTAPMPLPQDTYYWRVGAMDAAGNKTSGGPDHYRIFKVDYRTAPTPDKVIVAPRATGTPVTFSWQPASGAPAGTTYTIEIDSDGDGTADATLAPSTTASVMSPTLAPGDYHYRLAVGNELGTSGWRHFVIAAPP